jgi:hypothetical protein
MWEAEIRRIVFPGQEKKFTRLHLNGKNAGPDGACLSSQLQQEA